MAALFLIANRGAYKGYFQDDELDNISWAPTLSAGTFAEGLLTPKFLSGNFRPTGHFYFAVMAGVSAWTSRNTLFRSTPCTC